MQKPTIDEKRVRAQLKSKRNLLLKEYFRNSMNTHLAIEIKWIDDQIAELTEHLVQQKNSLLESGHQVYFCAFTGFEIAEWSATTAASDN
jgi:hypothetical protein